MQLEVYQTDAEAYEAAAAMAGAELVTVGRDRNARLAFGGGRGGRGILTALAEDSKVPWGKVECFFTDERCVPATDSASTERVARQSLLEHRGVPERLVHVLPPERSDPVALALAYEALLEQTLGAVDLDLVLLECGARGEIAGLMPGSRALAAAGKVAAVPVSEVTAEPFVARVTLTPAVLARGRRVIVTACGAERAAALAAALREPVDVARRPVQLVLPSERVTWFVDKAAADELLRDAQPAGAQ
jgi:6-phosphogluconolactonase